MDIRKEKYRKQYDYYDRKNNRTIFRVPWMKGEKPVPIPGEPGFFATSYGKILRVPKKTRNGSVFMGSSEYCVCKPKVDKDGYLLARVGNKWQKIHRLVVLAFDGEIEKGHQVCHMDGNRQNNDISNLRAGTQLNNMRDRDRHGTTARGSRIASSKLTYEMAAQMKYEHTTGTPVPALMLKYNLSKSQVYKILRGEYWKDSDGTTWEKGESPQEGPEQEGPGSGT